MLKQKMPILATPLNLIKMAKILAIKKKINSFNANRPKPSEIIVSEKDKNLPTFNEIINPF